MRTFILLTLCIAVVCGVPTLAQYTPTMTQHATPPSKINLDLKDTPLAAAVKSVFEAMGASYALDPAVTNSPVKVTMNLKGVAPDDALNAVLMAGGLTRRKQGDLYYVKPKATEPAVTIESPVPEAYPGQAQPREAERDPGLVPVTAVVPEMPIWEALAKIGAPCNLVDTFAKKTMPGARFFQFPMEMAKTVLFVAAGLVPPVGGAPPTGRAGQSDLSQLLQWVAGAKPTGSAGGTLEGSGSRYYTGGSHTHPGGPQPPNAPSPSGDLAIAAYPRDGKWLFVVFASHVEDTRVMEGLFSTSGRSYVMGDVSVRPHKLLQVLNGRKIESTSWTSWRHTVSAQLYDVTLDQALDALLPSLSLTYRKQGPAANPTYVVELGVVDLGASGKSTSATPASKVKPPVRKTQRR